MPLCSLGEAFDAKGKRKTVFLRYKTSRFARPSFSVSSPISARKYIIFILQKEESHTVEGLIMKIRSLFVERIPENLNPRSLPVPYNLIMAEKAAAMIACAAEGDHDPRTLSHRFSSILQRPTFVKDVSQLRHQPDPGIRLPQEHIDENAIELQKEAIAVLPSNEKRWNDWSFKIIAYTHGPNCAAHRAVMPQDRPTRLSGDHDVESAVITYDSRLSAADCWYKLSTLPHDNGIVFPSGEEITYFSKIHEGGHCQQRSSGQFFYNAEDEWLGESDADHYAIDGYRLFAQRQSSEDRIRIGNITDGIIAARTVAAFLNNDHVNYHFLQSEGHYESPFERNTATIDELRLRAYSALTGRGFSASGKNITDMPSDQMQRLLLDFRTDFVISQIRSLPLSGTTVLSGTDKAKIRGYLYEWCGHPILKKIRALVNNGRADVVGDIIRYTDYWVSTRKDRGLTLEVYDYLHEAFRRPFKWKDVNDPRQSIPLLDRLVKDGRITDPQAQKKAELVIASACMFYPNMAEQDIKPTHPIQPSLVSSSLLPLAA